MTDINPALFSKAHIRASLEARPSQAADDMLWLAGSSRELRARVRAAMPSAPRPAAVLVPLVERPEGLAVLLTERAATLKAHAGQISFPGGRIEAEDHDPWSAALREAQEEIGLAPEHVEFAGYLPDHLVGTGFRVTPAVGFVKVGYGLKLAAAEVHDAFEVPLDFDAANHKPRLRTLGDVTLETYDIPYRGRNIWGATAGMLMTLRRLLQEHASPAWRGNS